MKRVYKIEFFILAIIIILGGMFFFYTQRTDVIKINKDGIESILIHGNTAIIKADDNSELIRKIKEDLFHSFEPITKRELIEDIFGTADEVDETFPEFYYDFPNSTVGVYSLCYDNEPCAEWHLYSYPKDLSYFLVFLYLEYLLKLSTQATFLFY
ncbi:hypothetical protein HOB10_00720 [Candidatus Parcubacteria bacterium]|jgi:hypothetical protein|nr:hypothetical protein [Candidatus Parcubacteria bacterium]